MEPHLPKEIIYRPKTGDLFDPAGVRNLLELDRTGRTDAAYTIFSLICIERIKKAISDSLLNKIRSLIYYKQDPDNLWKNGHGDSFDFGEVIAFVVQMEVFSGSQWKAVIRYDSAHGFPHIDRYYPDGRKIKTELYLDFNEALVLADEDIKDNWKIYQREFTEGGR